MVKEELRGCLKISISKSQHNYWHCKIVILLCKFLFFLKKQQILCLIHLNLVVQHHYHFAHVSIQVSIQRHPSEFYKTSCLNFQRYPFISFLNKQLLQFFRNILVKKSMVNSFLNTLADLPGNFPKRCLEKLF